MSDVDPQRPGTGLLTDRYELSMVGAALRSGRAHDHCVFEVFCRHLPLGRRYGVVAGTERVLDAITSFWFAEEDLDWLAREGAAEEATREFLRAYRFGGRVEGYPEGEVFFPNSPILSVRGTFAECVVLETLVLSILNHDCAVAAAAARMVTVADGRPLIEMGSRRTNESAALAAARAAYLAGFASTSNLAAGRRYGIPTAGTAAHASILLYPDERAAFAAQVAAQGSATTLLVDTYDIGRGIEAAVEVAGSSLTAIRIDSGDLGVLARRAREQLDALGNGGTRIVLSGDLDEFTIAALAAAPVDAYGVGTAVAMGSGAPTAALVYKLVEVEGRPVSKRSDRKATHGGAKTAHRAYRNSGTATDEVVVVGEQDLEAVRRRGEFDVLRRVSEPLMIDGVRTELGAATLEMARRRVADSLRTLPWEGLSLSRGEPVLPTTMVAADGSA
jgi:nicotinate phosphoribosyltransferase